MSIRTTLVAAAAAIALMAGTLADANAKTFKFAAQGDFLGLDPHINNEGPTNAMKGNIYEGLIYRTPELKTEPSLATEWRQVDPTTWRFKLREGVTFHGGEKFTADDVIFSFGRVKQPQSEMSYTVQSVKEIKKIGDFEIELVTHGPDPILLQGLPLFYIMSKEWTEKNRAVDVVRGAAVQSFANLNANGTGPFIVKERVADTRTVVVPNAKWWGKPAHNLTEAVFTPIRSAPTRVSALLSGEIDMMYPVPLQDVARIDGSGSAKVLQGPELRTIFFGFDQFRDESLDMKGTGKNPFKDVRVRRAFYQAIDIEGIRRTVMRNASVVTGHMIAPGINGFTQDLNARFPFDPDGARKLLTEAGYPNGFPVTLDCPNDRYVNDEAICTAVIPMLRRIGVDAKLNAQTRSIHFNKIGKTDGHNTSMFMLGWTPGTFDSLNPLMELMTTKAGPGTWNGGRYSNPKVEALTESIKTEMDQNKRNAMIQEAFKIHREDFGHIPLHQQTLAWAVRNTVDKISQRPWDDVDLRHVVMK
jgi:peptide/nickel transport system substrate-binding protein